MLQDALATLSERQRLIVTMFEGQIYGFEAYSITGWVSVPEAFMRYFHFFAPAF